uniref:IMP dehydrogenase/GMP reductase, putative n=1 Tax=Medicago truncatula TaxID=3880 RepID=Q2HSL4_MEDTR|nr:IMP dehydrogenase/GMP reductase, putative [Medicago truncatula]
MCMIMFRFNACDDSEPPEGEAKRPHPKEGKRSEGGWFREFAGGFSGYTTEESQVVDPSQQVEYLNYQDQVHHNVTDGGYDQDHIPEEQHIADDDDIAATATLEVLPVDPPFPGGHDDLSLLHSYVRKLRVVKPINHGAKILSLGRPNGNQD